MARKPLDATELSRIIAEIARTTSDRVTAARLLELVRKLLEAEGA